MSERADGPIVVHARPHGDALDTMPNTLALFGENVRRFRAGGAAALSLPVDPDARH
jgi:hypothetical protein